MHFEAQTIDDLMRKVLVELLKRPFNINSRRSMDGENPTSEIPGASLLLKNPRARVSLSENRGKLFSALGEFLWYLSKDCDLEFIEYYIRNYKAYNHVKDGKVEAGYGPRLFNLRGNDQVHNIIKLLSENPASRRAVIQIFDAQDMQNVDAPCTCTLQFLLRDNKLQMVTYMRSNDAYTGLPHDIFAFTMLQELIAASLSVELGYYYHVAASLHLYANDASKGEAYLKQGYQSTDKKFAMPPMPFSYPWDQVEKLMQIERQIREEEKFSIEELDSYWSDLARLLQIFSLIKKKDREGILTIRNQIEYQNYHIAIDTKLE